MAKPSGGTIPPKQTIMNADQAVAMLSLLHHWSATKVNHEGQPPLVVVKITHAGRRVSAGRRTFVECAIAALEKLRGERQPKAKKRPAAIQERVGETTPTDVPTLKLSNGDEHG